MMISLKPAELKDRESIYRWCYFSDFSNNMFSPDYCEVEQTPTFDEFCNDYSDYFFTGDQPDAGRGYMIISNNEKIGFISYTSYHLLGRITEFDIWLNSESITGQGFGTEAIRQLLKVMFEHGYNEVIIRPYIKNTRAIKAYEKAGFNKKLLIPDKYYKEEYISYASGDFGEGEDIFLTITKEEWRNRQKAVIFDFNGTLFFDSSLHEMAWSETIQKICKRKITRQDIENHIHGKLNKVIVEYFCGDMISPAKFQLIANQKEELYRTLCMSAGKPVLANGATTLLNYLKKNEVPVNIATAADYRNLQFYIKHFNLDKWFNIDKIIFDNGKIEPKPHPQIFLEASNKINQSLSDCIILEDSLAGIRSAKSAGVAIIIYVSGDSGIPRQDLPPGIDYIIKDFTEFPYDIL